MLKCPNNYKCPMELFVELVGGKYKGMIFWYLHINKVMRFNQLSKAIKNATPKMLTQQLRELEKNGLIIRKVYAQVPLKVEYSLSDMGKTLIPILESMCNWARLYQENFNTSSININTDKL